ncbi:MAG TPA: helix-turn-helix transcriptional regulator [Thermoanaerobaculia bacterium]|nr:helix-turn-helix transcriptional regulator [Thermoanaerobaculia bacterium]
MRRRKLKPGEPPPPENLKIRLFRALTVMTQEELADASQIDSGTLGGYETFLHRPEPDKLQRAARAANLSPEFGDEVLRLAEIDRLKRLRPGRSAEDFLTELGETVKARALELWRRLLALPLPPRVPREEDRLKAREQLPLLRGYTPAQRAAVLKLDDEHQPWALALEAGEAAVRATSRDPQEATEWAQLAREMAEAVEGPDGWPTAIRSLAVAYDANTRRIPGELKSARVLFEEAKRLAKAGSDPYNLLDPGRLLDLEASLCRDERNFPDALRLLERAVLIGRSPARALIKKGFTLEVMGEYEEAAKALLKAERKLDRKAEARLWVTQRFNLSVVYSHLGKHEEAFRLMEEARPVAQKLGDEIVLIKFTWLEGRLLVGLGRGPAARCLLEEVIPQFEKLGLWYDVWLAGLELAGLLLDEGKTAEVKAMTPVLAKAFESEGVHREALGALKLFQEAAEREAATAELARRVLSYLFRARHDPSVKFGERPEASA